MKKCLSCLASWGARFLRLRVSVIFVVVLAHCPVRAQVAPEAIPGAGIPCGHFSSMFLRPQDISYPNPSPTRISLMTSRWSTLQMSAAGYQRTGVPLVGWDGTHLVATESKDDSGLDYFVPRLSTLFHLSLANGVDIFIGGIIVVCSSLGLAGLLVVLRGTKLKIWAAAEMIVLALLCLRVGDVYVVQAAVVIVAVPWVLYFSRRWNSRLQVPFFLLTGVVLGIANLVRAQSGIAVLLFALPLLAFFGDASARRRGILLACLLAGTASTTLYFRHAFMVRDAYLEAHQPDYSVPSSRQHPLWHSVYIGLGFVSNPYVPGGYCDTAGLNGVRAVSPGTSFFSPDYDRILGEQVYSLARNHPYVVLVNLAAKLGILQLMLLLAGNVGLLAAVWHRRPLALEIAFLLAAGFGFLPGLMVIPVPKYVIGGIAISTLYGLICLDGPSSNRATRDRPESREVAGRSAVPA